MAACGSFVSCTRFLGWIFLSWPWEITGLGASPAPCLPTSGLQQMCGRIVPQLFLGLMDDICDSCDRYYEECFFETWRRLVWRIFTDISEERLSPPLYYDTFDDGKVGKRPKRLHCTVSQRATWMAKAKSSFCAIRSPVFTATNWAQEEWYRTVLTAKTFVVYCVG
jgi:hypothetical protein